MIAEAIHGHMRKEARAEQALLDHAVRAGRGLDAFLTFAAGVLRALDLVRDGSFQALKLSRAQEADFVHLATAGADLLLLGQLVARSHAG